MFHVTARIFTSDNVHSLDNVTWLKKTTFSHERIFQKYYWLIFVQFFMWFYTGYRISYNYKSDISERGNFKGQFFLFLFIIPKGVGVTKNSSQQPATRLVLILPGITNVWINYNLLWLFPESLPQTLCWLNIAHFYYEYAKMQLTGLLFKYWNILMSVSRNSSLTPYTYIFIDWMTIENISEL